MESNAIFSAYSDSIEMSANATMEDMMNAILTGAIHNLDFRAAVLNVAMMTIAVMQPDISKMFFDMLEDTVADVDMLESIREEFKKGEGLNKTYLLANNTRDINVPSFTIAPSKTKS